MKLFLSISMFYVNTKYTFTVFITYVLNPTILMQAFSVRVTKKVCMTHVCKTENGTAFFFYSTGISRIFSTYYTNKINVWITLKIWRTLT